MKKTKEHQGLVVDNEVIAFANLDDEIALSATDRLIILRKQKMTAMDMVKMIEAMTEVTEHLLNILAQVCGTCDKCESCKDLDTDNIHIPDYILEVAGIPKDAKLTAFAEEDSGIVRVEQADYDCALADVSVEMRQFFSGYGICMGELDALRIRGDLIYG